MLHIIITALLSLGFITDADQATPEIYQQNQTEVNQYIIDTDISEV